MKVIHLLGWYFPESVGGTEIYVAGLCRRLRAADHEVAVAAPIAQGRTAHAATRHYVHDDVPVYRYAIPDAPLRNEAYHRVPVRGADELYAWLAEQRPDWLHVHSFTTGVGLPEIREARRLGIRVVATCHLPGLGYMCRTGELMQWGRTPCDGVVWPRKCSACNLTRLGMSAPLASLTAALPVPLSAGLGAVPGRVGTALGMSASVAESTERQRELFDLIEAFVVLNETARAMLTANGSPAPKIVVNRLGVGQAGLTRKPGPDARPTAAAPRIGYVGRLHATKGLVELVRAVMRIPREVSMSLEIRGPESDVAAQRFAADLRALAAGDPRIQFAPAVSPEEVPRVLAALDALACPSICFENGPTVALEANAVGTPVIASRVGNLQELVDDGVNGRLLPPGDVAAWSDAIADVARRPGQIDEWRRRISEPRTMDDVARDYLRLYAA
ncbi:MAG TPA: glycosyltransferase [Vicinamibacterales bacterium]|jgi:glycosyltransferase involved in cell wall biosynthesis|nr:glycosyltransferase [Vicinamibacterales bacterium]